MFLKSGYSFVAMLAINPVVILFYQQCSMIPTSYASKESPPIRIERGLASTEQPKALPSSEKRPFCADLENCVATKIK